MTVLIVSSIQNNQTFINMNTKSSLLNFFVVLAIVFFVACDEEEEVAPVVELNVQLAEDIPADIEREGNVTFFNFENGIVASSLSSTKSWDIALSGTAILTNGGSSGPGEGGAQIVSGTFESITEAPESGYEVDTEANPAIKGSDGWYTYTGDAPSGPKHAVITVPGRVIVLRTAEGNYAKMEILSYYEGNPNTTTEEFENLATRPTSRFYTFRYVVQPNGSRIFSQ